MNAIKRIREFIRTQRYIGANEKLNLMRERYSKTADKFYEKYGAIYYVNENGQSIGLNIKTIWHFVTLEDKIAELESQLKQAKEEIKHCHNIKNKCQHENTFPVDHNGNSQCHDCGKFISHKDI